MTNITTKSFDGTVEVCCHRVTFRYWDFDHELTADLMAALTEAAEIRAQECIIDGYRSGELNCYYIDEDEEEIRGWWEISNT